MENHDTTVYVNGSLVKKSEAVISVYDSGFCHGDGVYEGIRVYNGKVFRLDEHLVRLFEAAKAVAIDVGVTRDEMKEIVLKTLRANSLRNDLHMRLMVTRGRKRVTGMNTKFNVGPASIVVLVDHKEPIFDKKGVSLVTSSFRRASPDVLDAKVHNMNQLNQILACIEASRHGGDEAVMLDPRGFVAETNGTTMFMVKDGVLLTPTMNYIIVGFTRGLVMGLASEKNITVVERDLSLYEFYNAHEAFICGTVGEIAPIREIDGRQIGTETPGRLTAMLMEAYSAVTANEGTPIDAV